MRIAVVETHAEAETENVALAVSSAERVESGVTLECALPDGARSEPETLAEMGADTEGDATEDCVQKLAVGDDDCERETQGVAVAQVDIDGESETLAV